MTTTWKIEQLDRNISDGLVTIARFRVNAIDGNYSASYSDLVIFQRGESFTDYSSLTEAQVIVWVKEKLDVEAIEANLAAEIAAKKAPTTAVGVPW